MIVVNAEVVERQVRRNAYKRQWRLNKQGGPKRKPARVYSEEERRALNAEKARRCRAKESPERRAVRLAKMKEYREGKGREIRRQGIKQWRKKRLDDMTAEEREAHRVSENKRLRELWAASPPERKAARGRKVSECAKIRKRKDPSFNLRCRIACRTATAFAKSCAKKHFDTMSLVGMSQPEFLKYITSRLSGGMTIENRCEWHIDHWYPLSAADMHNEHEVRAVCHWSNLRPMWGKENMSKSDRIEPDAKQHFDDLVGLFSLSPEVFS